MALGTLTPADPHLFFSKQDAADPRLGDVVFSSADGEPADTRPRVFGWPDDDGIRLNGGRVGAAQGPDRIRRSLYRMTPPMGDHSSPAIVDRGNLSLTGDLPHRHQQARRLAGAAYGTGAAVLTLGGGHDYGFPDAAAFLDHFLADPARVPKPLVINFDAHLDVRPTDAGFHSGTPFRRLLEEFSGRFDFLEIGLQPHCNSRDHRAWAQTHGAELWMADDVRTADSLRDRLGNWLNQRQGRPLFVSLDIDVVSSVSAPGCSQSWDRGLASDRLFEALALLDDHTDWRGLGLYEVSPPLDTDDRTAKLAALFAYEFLTRRSR